MFKNAFILIVFTILWVASCKAQETLGTFHKLSTYKSINYQNAQKQTTVIHDSITMKKIIELISTARKTPSKFIILDQIIIEKEDGSAISIKRKYNFLMVDGITFVIKKKDNILLDQLLNRSH